MILRAALIAWLSTLAGVAVSDAIDNPVLGLIIGVTLFTYLLIGENN